MKLVVGLGNIGEKYKNTRHNLGFEVLDKLASNFENENFENLALVSKKQINNNKLLLIKPTLFMNNSGIAIRRIKDYYKIELQNILIIVDDSAIELGNIRLRPNGSSGGHNGLKSIISSLGTMDFARLRLGIGTDTKNTNLDLADFVLSKFRKDEMNVVDEMIHEATLAVDTWINEGSETVMQKFNKKK